MHTALINDKNGGKIKTRFNDRGELHHKKKAAFICYHENGKIWYKAYYINGKKHHDTKAAVTTYWGPKRKKLKEYYINGIELTKEEFDLNKQKYNASNGKTISKKEIR